MQELIPKGMPLELARAEGKLIRNIARGDDFAVESHFNALEDRAKKHGFVEARRVKKIGRNQVCPCGSGVKFKKCCLHRVRDV